MFDKKNSIKGYLYLTPALILISLFTIYPVIKTVLVSFMIKYDYLNNTFQGFGFYYYKLLFENPVFRDRFFNALGNTFVITFVSVPISVAIALAIAVALNSIKRLQPIFQTIFFLPYVTNVIAIGLVFSFMFNKDYGLVNTVMGWFGIDPVNWKGPGASHWNAMFTLLVYTIWTALPFKIMVFLAGLQNIDKQYYQAAEIDATPRLRVFWRITVPLLSPMIAYITIVSFIGAFKTYASVISMFGASAGPAGKPESVATIVWFVYDFMNNAEQPGRISMASAISVILFLIILVFTAIQMQVSKKRVHY